MSTGKFYTDKELCFFRLAKCVIDYSSAALRKVFEREWNKLYPNSRWRGNRRSGLQLVRKEIRSSSRLYCADYKRIKDNLEGGNTDDWDVTALVFVLKFSHALQPIRDGSQRWKKINKAISQIKEVKNAKLSHSPRPSLCRHTFERNVDILIQAVEDLLSRSDPLVEKLQTLRNENDFTTDGQFRYGKMPKYDQDNLLRPEDKMQQQPSTVKAELRGPETSCDNGNIISRKRHRNSKLKREVESRSVDLFPSHSIPAIFESARYIRLVNTSFSLSYNFRWKDLTTFFKELDDGSDMQLFAGIQLAVSLSHQSRKGEALDLLDSLIPKVLQAKHRYVY